MTGQPIFAKVYAPVPDKIYSQNSDFVLGFGNTSITNRRVFDKHDISPGSLLRYKVYACPEIWISVLSYEASFYSSFTKFSQYRSGGFYGFKFGYKFSQYLSAGIAVDSGPIIAVKRNAPEIDSHTRSYYYEQLYTLFPSDNYKGGLGLYGKFQYPLWWPFWETTTFSPFMFYQITTNGISYTGFGVMVSIGHYYR